MSKHMTADARATLEAYLYQHRDAPWPAVAAAFDGWRLTYGIIYVARKRLGLPQVPNRHGPCALPESERKPRYIRRGQRVQSKRDPLSLPPEQLTPVEAFLLAHRDDPLSDADVGRQFGLSRERIRQVRGKLGIPSHKSLRCPHGHLFAEVGRRRKGKGPAMLCAGCYPLPAPRTHVYDNLRLELTCEDCGTVFVKEGKQAQTWQHNREYGYTRFTRCPACIRLRRQTHFRAVRQRTRYSPTAAVPVEVLT